MGCLYESSEVENIHIGHIQGFIFGFISGIQPTDNIFFGQYNLSVFSVSKPMMQN